MARLTRQMMQSSKVAVVAEAAAKAAVAAVATVAEAVGKLAAVEYGMSLLFFLDVLFVSKVQRRLT